MIFMVRMVVILQIVLYAVVVQANPAKCRIDVEIRGMENKKVILGVEYGIKELVIDTISLDSSGKGWYESKSRLTGGIYIVLLPNQKYFEILVNDEQFFTISTDTANIISNLKIEGAEEPDLFRQYIQMASYFKSITENRKEADMLLIQKEKINIEKFKDSIIIKLPGSFLSKYFKMQADPEIPELKSLDKNKLDAGVFKKIYQLKYEHYFDNIDFNDARLLHTRLIGEKLNYFFNVFVSNNADSLCKAIDKVMVLANANNESYRFVLNIINMNFRTVRYPSHERALVYLADNYYLNGKAPWADPKFLKLFEEKVNSYRTTMIGATAPDLELQDVKGEVIKLSEIKAKILIVYFWSPDCNKCTQETPKLKDLYNKYKGNGLEVLAIYAHADKQVWIDYIQRNSLDWVNAYDPLMKSNFSKLYSLQTTPKLVLLDYDKKILDKNISPMQAERLIEKLLH
jgi:thiol-disulfide isomerase/thioredoxin